LSAATNFLNAAGRMLDRGTGDDGPGLDVIRGAVHDAATQLLRAGSIVRRLRDFVGRGEADMRSEDASDVILEACDVARSDGALAGVSMRVSVPANVAATMMDRTQIQQVLLNLIRNAAEALQGRVDGEITVSASRNADEGVDIVVSDNGPGLAPEIEQRLFQPFASTKAGGMGIGLAICRTIVEGHGGSLDAMRNVDGGVTFRIALGPTHREEHDDV
jgi:two-component system sensor kinase FixL